MSVKMIKASARIFIGVIFVMGLLMAPVRHIASHDFLKLAQAEASRHAELSIQFDDHGHTHNDGAADENRSGHLHGHNPADHSHETAAASLLAAPSIVSDPKSWSVTRVFDLEPVHVPSFERPPRS